MWRIFYSAKRQTRLNCDFISPRPQYMRTSIRVKQDIHTLDYCCLSGSLGWGSNGSVGSRVVRLGKYHIFFAGKKRLLRRVRLITPIPLARNWKLP